MSLTHDLVRKASGLPAGALALVTHRLPVRGHGAAVLCYHDIGTDPANRTEYYLGPELLRSHIEWMRLWGLTIVPLGEIVDRMIAGRDLDGLVALTFDDALTGVGTEAARVLEATRAPATVFVVSDELGIEPPFWSGASRTLTAPELRALTASGLVRLGSHTAHHVELPTADDATRAAELAASRAALEEISGSPVDLFAYPSGRFDRSSADAVRASGYRAAFTFTFGRVTPATDRFAIPRFCMTAAHDRLRLARQLARVPRRW
jgi:peptidoglycan/xylan/chitin deacetylase (PgdA/CDA1 family)